MNIEELSELVVADAPFMLVLYQVTFKDRLSDSEAERQKRMYWIREYIDSSLLNVSPDSITLQMDKDTVLTLIFRPDASPELESALDALQHAFEADRDLFCLTVSSSPAYASSESLTLAYEQTRALLLQRTLNGRTQRIRSPRSPRAPVHLSALEEEEFHTRLQSGNEQAVMEWVGRQLSSLAKREATVEQFKQLAKEIVWQKEKFVVKRNLRAAGELPAPDYGPLDGFYDIRQYERWLAEQLAPVAALVNERTTEKDPMTDFIVSYVDTHLSEDISLDLIADKLNLTAGYLSTYFKEKTGTNFSEYLNGLRVQRAKELLRNLDTKIQEASLQVGYQNVNSFIRMFKRYSGMTPGEYRKKYGSQEP